MIVATVVSNRKGQFPLDRSRLSIYNYIVVKYLFYNDMNGEDFLLISTENDSRTRRVIDQRVGK